MKTIKILMTIKATKKGTTVFVAARREQNQEWRCVEATIKSLLTKDDSAILSAEEYTALCEQIGEKYDFDCDAVDHKEIA